MGWLRLKQNNMSRVLNFDRRLVFPFSRGPLPEVREGDWAQWEASVAAGKDSDTRLDASEAQGLHPIPAPVEVDWTTWEQVLLASELP